VVVGGAWRCSAPPTTTEIPGQSMIGGILVRIFITGATGFIGHHLVVRLAEEGHELVCLVRKSSRADFLKAKGARLVYGDVTDREAMRIGMEGCDWLFHLANLYSMWEPDTAAFARINIEGTRCVLETALEVGVKKVIYVSTVAVFGKPEALPFDEQSLPGPVYFSEYARTKAAADRLAWDLYQRKGLPLVVLYPGIVLGAGDGKASGIYIQDIVNRRVPSTIFHDSTATYVHVADVITALLRAAQQPETVGQKYLIGKHRLTGREFTRLISQISGVALPLFRFPDWMVLAAAYLLTGLSWIIRRPPIWGLSIDAAWTLKKGFWCDGSKAERELGRTTYPITI
jgi:dihydroflavonol-4-reductase